MKILYVVPEGEDLGGIITATEHFMQGFRDLEHEVTCVLVRGNALHGGNSAVGRRQEAWKDAPNWRPSNMPGYWVHPVLGWRGPYLSMRADVARFVALARRHDAVVWAAMYGLRARYTEGTNNWTRMFTDHGRPNVAQIRDDHLVDRYPWVAALAPWITAWAGVHRISFDTCRGLGRRAIVHSAQDVSPVSMGEADRARSIFSCQTAKSWKKVDALVRAVPHLAAHRIKTVLAGDGIELRYMRSKEKCKPRYVCTPETDPNALVGTLGKRIWENAQDRGDWFQWTGCLPEGMRNVQMLSAQFFIDLSRRAGCTGAVNRTFIEAVRHGAVPLGDPSFVGYEIFQPFKDYLPVSSTWRPKELADRINDYFDLSEEKLESLRHSARSKIVRFDRTVAAAQIVDLIEGKSAGWDYADDVDEAVLDRGRAEFEKIFGHCPDHLVDGVFRAEVMPVV
jgi:glycosyltransferase involved in cell wall biosynthesis